MTEVREYWKEQRQLIRIKLVQDIKDRLFAEKNDLTFGGNSIEIVSNDNRLRLTCNFNMSDRIPRGVNIWTNPAKEIELTIEEEEQVKEELRIFINGKFKQL